MRFVKAGDRLINPEQIVEVKVTPATEPEEVGAEDAWEYDRDGAFTIPARPLSVEVVTTATTSSWDDGGDYPEFKHTDFHPYVIRLVGDEAEEFLSQVYIPSDNGSQPASVMAGRS